MSGPYLWNHYSQRLQIECVAWSCGLILHCCSPSNSLRYFYFIYLFIYLFFFLLRFFFSADFFFLSFFLSFSSFPATILSEPFASLISSLINIISLLLTTFDWTKVWGIAPRSHTGRPRTCLVIIIIDIIVINTTVIIIITIYITKLIWKSLMLKYPKAPAEKTTQ